MNTHGAEPTTAQYTLRECAWRLLDDMPPSAALLDNFIQDACSTSELTMMARLVTRLTFENEQKSMLVGCCIRKHFVHNQLQEHLDRQCDGDSRARILVDVLTTDRSATICKLVEQAPFEKLVKRIYAMKL